MSAPGRESAPKFCPDQGGTVIGVYCDLGVTEQLFYAVELAGGTALAIYEGRRPGSRQPSRPEGDSMTEHLKQRPGDQPLPSSADKVRALGGLDAAYLAGLLDGEGTIGVRPRPNGYVNLELGICMTTPAPLRWAQEVTGVGGIYHRPEKRENRRDAWFWKVSACAEIAAVISQVVPYLKVKEPEARGFLVLAHLRRLKSRPTGPSLHREAEHMVARVLSACKAGDDQAAYEEAMDLTVYLRSVLAERDDISGVAAVQTRLLERERQLQRLMDLVVEHTRLLDGLAGWETASAGEIRAQLRPVGQSIRDAVNRIAGEDDRG